MLYIDCDHLKPNEESQGEFREFEKPNLENEKKIKVVGVFNETVIVTDEFSSSCFLFISYRGFQIKLSRKIDAISCFQNHLQLVWTRPRDMYFLPGVARMAVRTDKNFIIIDLRFFQITQMLTFREKFSMYYLKFECSKYDKALYLFGANPQWCGIYHPEMGEFILKFGIWQGMTLQELCANAIVNYFNVSEIKSFSLPQVLIEEILSFKLY